MHKKVSEKLGWSAVLGQGASQDLKLSVLIWQQSQANQDH